MNQQVTRGIILSRTNYGEADRIVRMITTDKGKISLMARGVRRQKSKLAGGIELFSVSSLTYVSGRGDLGRLISGRLEIHYGNIAKQIDRVQMGYELIKALDRATEDEPEPEYFTVLQTALAALDDLSGDIEVVRLWFYAQVLQIAGHSPNLMTNVSGARLTIEAAYSFDFDSVAFAPATSGKFTANHIKFLRLAFAGTPPPVMQQVQEASTLTAAVLPLVRTMITSYIRV